jgi:hypothetical protein
LPLVGVGIFQFLLMAGNPVFDAESLGNVALDFPKLSRRHHCRLGPIKANILLRPFFSRVAVKPKPPLG